MSKQIHGCLKLQTRKYVFGVLNWDYKLHKIDYGGSGGCFLELSQVSAVAMRKTRLDDHIVVNKLILCLNNSEATVLDKFC